MSTERNLAARVSTLEDEIIELKDELTVSDEEGTEWSLSDLTKLGLTRREALASLGILAAYGGSIYAAIGAATDKAAAADDTSRAVSTPSLQTDIYLDEIRDPNDDVRMDVDPGTLSMASANEIQWARQGVQGLQAAINSLPSTGGTVMVEGDVGISSTVTVPSNVTISGYNARGARIFNDGVSAGNYMIESADEDYVHIENVNIDGVDQSVNGVRMSAPNSQPTHHLNFYSHVVNCDTGIFYDKIEDSWIWGGRVGNCNTGIKYDVPAGFGGIIGPHVVNCDTYSLDIDARTMAIGWTICGSPSLTHHVNVRSDTEQISLQNCWFETTPPVMDTGTNTLTHLEISGASRILLGNGNDAFIGNYNHVNIDSLGFTDNDGTSVELFGSNPERVMSGNVKLIGSASWSAKGFAYLYGPTENITDRTQINPSLQQRRANVEESITAGTTSLTVDFPGQEPDSSYGVMIEPRWDTTHYISNQTTDTFTVEFGTGPPSDTTFAYWTYRDVL